MCKFITEGRAHFSTMKYSGHLKSVLFILLYISILIVYMLVPTLSMSNYGISAINNTMSVIKSGQQSGPTLCVIVRTFQGQYDYLTITLLSLSYNPKSNIRMYLLLTDETSSVKDAQSIALNANNLIGQDMVSVLPITFQDAHVLKNDTENDYGYSYTDAALNYLMKKDTTEQCQYFLITNGDNLYTKSFVDDYISKDMNESYDIIGYDFISHHKRISSQVDRYIYNDGSRVHVDADFVRSRLDLGAFIIKKEFLRQYDELRFLKQKLASRNSIYHDADGYFIEYANSKTEKKIIHRQILFMHQ